MATTNQHVERDHGREVPRRKLYDLREFEAITGVSMTVIQRGIRGTISR